MKKLMMMAIASLMLCLGMQDPMASEKKAVERAVLDYVEGVYEVKPEYIERSVHPDLAKIGYGKRSADDDYQAIPMTYDQLVRLAGSYNANGRIGEDAPKKVEVLDMLDQTASAKLTAEWGIDYMHLAKLDGTWKIMHVLWQTHPMD